MNVALTGCNYTSINNNTLRKQNINISFNGSKTAIMEKAKSNAGCAGLGLLLVALYPFVLLSKILSSNKNEKIRSMTLSMQNEYADHTGNFKYFNDEVNDMNKFLDKHTINDEYAQFVKEAMEFLRKNFEQNDYEWQRLAIFPETPGMLNFEFYKFMDTINKSAKAAVSKNSKDINEEKLDKDIQKARAIMQQNI